MTPERSSLDVLVLDDGTVADQVRFEPTRLRKNPAAPVEWLRALGPFDLIAGPSGYGLPLVTAADCTDAQLALMALVRRDEKAAKGVGGFSAVARAFRDSGLPVVFLPGVIHLPTVPDHRKLNTIDKGTPDKLCVAALAIAHVAASKDPHPPKKFAVAEFGTAFAAGLRIDQGAIVDGTGGTAGAIGGRSGGRWDGEVAYLLSPLRKLDLFAGGLDDATTAFGTELAEAAFFDSAHRMVRDLAESGGFISHLYLSGALLEARPALDKELAKRLRRGAALLVKHLQSLPGATVKHAAQGAALIADGLAGGRYKSLVYRLRLREASGTVLDWLSHPRAGEVRKMFGL